MRRSLVCAFLLICVSISSQAQQKPERNFAKPVPVHLDRKGEKWAEATLKKMSLEEKIGQLFMIRVRAEFLNDASPQYAELVNTIRTYHIGCLLLTVSAEGPFIYKNEPYEAAALLNRLQSESNLPLLIAADFERGLSNRLNGAAAFPQAMAFGATGKPEYAEAFGRITAEEARAIGVQWNLFPVADVNSNPANPIINTRAFGEDPAQVGTFVAAYIRGARAHGMLTTAKHFPGHGDTATDSHLGLAQVTADVSRLNSVELAPFRQAIAAGVDGIMVAHVTVPALDPTPNRVATTSPAIVTDVIRKQLGYQGLVATDALDMGALTSQYLGRLGQSAVDAFEAGNDVLVFPADLDACYRAMLQAAKDRQFPMSRLDESVLRILKAKASVGLDQSRLVDLAELPQLVGRPENVALGQQIADDAITLVRDNGRVLPLKQTGTVSSALPYLTAEETHDRVVAVVFSDDVRLDYGRVFEKQVRARVPDANVLYVDPRLASPMTPTILAHADQAQTVITAIYEVPTAGKVASSAGPRSNSVSLSGDSAALLHEILRHEAERTLVVAMGNPYLAQDFPEVQNYLCTYSNTAGSEVSAVKALFGEMGIHGRLPVTIPNLAERGSGIDRQPVLAERGSQHEQTITVH